MFQENHFYDDLLPGIAFPSKERFLLVGGKKLNQICSYCFRDLSSQFMVHCAECECFQLCSDCFSVGVELSPHKNTHSYRIVDNLDFPVLTKDWTALEELLLLEGKVSLDFTADLFHILTQVFCHWVLEIGNSLQNILAQGKPRSKWKSIIGICIWEFMGTAFLERR